MGTNNQWVEEVAKRCLTDVTVHPIADVRRTADRPLDNEALFRLSQEGSLRTGGSRWADWTQTLEHVLQDVFGPSVRYVVRPERDNSGDFRLSIDGEQDVPLNQVGAGVREVVAIAYAALSTEGATVLTIEEPENCLHPMAVRNLVGSLATRCNVQLFVATHSSAVINADPGAILHLTRSDGRTTGVQVNGDANRYDAIRSLGYSPADLVLTPCAVWVEGPSDRVYLTAWLATHDLVEGRDYQVMFYGGSVGAHLSASADTIPEQQLVAIRNLSRRCVIVADDDRDRPNATRKAHVRRYRDEMDGDPHAHLLVTWGREVENYLPVDVANELRSKHKGGKQLKPAEYRWARVLEPQLTRRVSKVALAEQALGLMDGVPPNARKDIAALAEFIKKANVAFKEGSE